MEAIMNHSTKKSKEEYWKEQIARYHQSGQNRRQYCLAENLSYWTFCYWLKKIESTADTKLVKIPRQVHPKKNERQSYIEIIVTQKISIRVAKGFDGELLRDLLSELGVAL